MKYLPLASVRSPSILAATPCRGRRPRTQRDFRELTERLLAETEAANGVVVGPLLIGAWARTLTE